MAHRLVPESGSLPLEPGEVIQRLRRQFSVVDENREAGARHIDQMIAQFQRMNAPSTIIEAHRRMRDETIHVVVTDDPLSDVAYLSFAVMPGEGVFIGYHSKQHEDAARLALEKCARVLGCEIVLV